MTAQRMVWFGNRMVPESEARISIYDSALMFGDSCFEMSRSFNIQQFQLREHLERLQRSARYLQIPLPPFDELKRICFKVINANDPAMARDDEHRLLIIATRGLLSIYGETVGETIYPQGPYVIVSDFPLRWTVRGMGQYYDTGISMAIVPQQAITPPLIEPRLKHRSRIHLQMANMQASLCAGHPWPLMTDAQGNITEGTGCNFFVVKGDQLWTPRSHGILEGISRRYVIENLKAGRVEQAERDINLYDVIDADEAFVTATPFCILPVTSVNGYPIGTGKPGEHTMTLLEKWSTRVGVNIPSQIKKWDLTSPALTGTTPYQFHKETNECTERT